MTETTETKSPARQPSRLARIPFIGEALDRHLAPKPIVAVLPLTGVIAPGGMGTPLRRGGLNLAALDRSIEIAFRLPRLKAVALAVNSPGGSPVQSALIARRIRQLAEEKKVPVLAFCEDAAASGGYWLACAADEIFADGASIVGSIGVITSSFGFTGAMEKLGVDRRVYTAGNSKSQLDPFLPENPDDVLRLRELQNDLHAQFKDWVMARRGGKLAQDQDLFDGRFWTGRRGLELGLIDGLGDLHGICRARFGKEVVFRRIGQRRGFLSRWVGATLPERLGGSIAEAALEAAEARAAWARIGL